MSLSKCEKMPKLILSDIKSIYKIGNAYLHLKALLLTMVLNKKIIGLILLNIDAHLTLRVLDLSTVYSYCPGRQVNLDHPPQNQH